MHSLDEERRESADSWAEPAAVSVVHVDQAGGVDSKGEDQRATAGTRTNVLDAALRRIAVAFRDFDNVLVAFSCGKDSGVLLNLAYKYAKENGLLHKLGFYYEDYEAGYRYTDEYAARMFRELHDVQHRYWLCLPISAACAVSMYEPRWIPWDRDKKDIWVRPMPDEPYVIHQDNCPYPFVKGTKGFDARIQFAEWYSATYGPTAVFIGLRAQESLTRRIIFTSDKRTEMHKGLKYTKRVDPRTVNFYPLYDWITEDIWTCNAKFGFDYNKIYDLYYQAGLTIDQMRVASPFHQSGQNDLKLYRVIDPNNWGRMVGRVNGCNFGGIYGGTTAMGWRTITKPDHFTWKQYAEFLLSTLPGGTKKKFEHQIARFRKEWAEKGRGRNPEVIRAMRDEGLEIENTNVVSKRCTKPKLYEVVRIKSDFPDELKGNYSTPFRHCPSWKAVCITIMKNDVAMTYMGLTRTRDQNISRQKALDKYAARKAKLALESEDE
jgi:predicted phosphoadenosine phosphosulfate sulfurtransferase